MYLNNRRPYIPNDYRKSNITLLLQRSAKSPRPLKSNVKCWFILMSYCKISHCHVFLHRSLHSQILSEVLKDKPSVYKVSSFISGSDANKETENEIIYWLEQKFKENPSHFKEQFVKFSLIGEDARSDVFDLLFDWCSLSKLGRIADNRDVVDNLISDHEGESLLHPAGKVFHIVVKAIPHNSFINRLFSSFKEVRVEIDTQKVSRLEGVISDFNLVMGQIVLSFNTKGIKIESCA